MLHALERTMRSTRQGKWENAGTQQKAWKTQIEASIEAQV